MTNKYNQKHKKRLPEEARKKHVKIFLKKKNTKGGKGLRVISIFFFEKQKQKLLEYMKNYYLAHKK